MIQNGYRPKGLPLILAMVLLCGMLTGCGLLPEEEEFKLVPVFTEDVVEEFTYVAVTRGDIFSHVSVTARYEPAAEATYSFNLNNVAYGTVYVELGDTVQEGDLLAELDMGSIEEDLYACDLDLIAAYAEQEYLEKMVEIAAKRYVLNGESEEAAQASAEEEYSLELERNELTRSLLETMKEELEEQRENRRIYSEIDGVVSFLLEISEGDTSRRGRDFITIVDATMTFTTATGKWQYYQEGDEVTLEISGKEYTGTINQLIDEGNRGQMTVQMVLNTSVAGLKQGDRANAIVTTGKRYQVLYLPSRAVTTAGGQKIVYVEEDGIKRIKEIETGFVGDDSVEILSGLAEGDLVVMQ